MAIQKADIFPSLYRNGSYPKKNNIHSMPLNQTHNKKVGLPIFLVFYNLIG